MYIHFMFLYGDTNNKSYSRKLINSKEKPKIKKVKDENDI